MDVGWPEEGTRKKIQMIFDSYLIGKSASDLLVLAERVEQETAEPEDKGSSSAGTSGSSGWGAPAYDGPGDWDGGSGGGDWSV